MLGPLNKSKMGLAMKILIIEDDVIINNIKKEKEMTETNNKKSFNTIHLRTFHIQGMVQWICTQETGSESSYPTTCMNSSGLISTLGFLLCKTKWLGISKVSSRSI